MKDRNLEVVSSSAITLGPKYTTPQALSAEEIAVFVSDFAQAARNAMAAGFARVGIHGANGYLIDQFTQTTANRRSDEYGGSIENRSRFAVEVTTAVADAIGTDRVWIRLSPSSEYQGMRMKDPTPQFTHLIKELKKLNLAYLHLVEGRISGGVDKAVAANDDKNTTESLRPFIEAWGNISPVIVVGGFTGDDATRKYIDDDYANTDIAIAIGRPFTSNPDLPFRVRHGIELCPYDRSNSILLLSGVSRILLSTRSFRQLSEIRLRNQT